MGLLLFFSIIYAVTIGPTDIPLASALSIIAGMLTGIPLTAGSTPQAGWETIILQIRLPRILMAVVVGASLAGAGTAMQGLFRNPMADPFIIGVSSGAAVGAAFSLVLNALMGGTTPQYVTSLFAFIGGVAAVFLVYNISKAGGDIPVETLLLAGVAIAFFLSALTSFILYTFLRDLISILYFSTGYIGGASWGDLLLTFPPVAVGLAILVFFTRDLNGMLLGEETAKHLGVGVELAKKIVLAISALITAAVVAVTGIIGFVGLIIPHIMRLIVGPDHRILLPSAVIVGAAFLVWSDALARTIIAPAEIPVGIITALLGAPFFIYLLWRHKRRG